jgi:hypothetical protein
MAGKAAEKWDFQPPVFLGGFFGAQSDSDSDSDNAASGDKTSAATTEADKTEG